MSIKTRSLPESVYLVATDLQQMSALAKLCSRIEAKPLPIPNAWLLPFRGSAQSLATWLRLGLPEPATLVICEATEGWSLT